MGRRHRRRRGLRAEARSGGEARRQIHSPFLATTGRRALLAGTALVSTLIASTALSTPAAAQAIIIVSNSSINFTRNSNCVSFGTCLAATTIPLISPGASITLRNNGDLATIGPASSTIFASTDNNRAPISITNTGDLATAGLLAYGIEATTYGPQSPISIFNSGNIATLGFYSHGIFGLTTCCNANLSITNSGNLATLGVGADGISGTTFGPNSSINITNSGNIATRGAFAEGIYATVVGNNSSLSITNSGSIVTRGAYAHGISGMGDGLSNSDVRIVNSGDVTATGAFADGIFGITYYSGSSLTIENSGRTQGRGFLGYGITGVTLGPGSPIVIENSGDVSGSTAGIYTYTNTSTTIVNTGSISASNNLAIDTEGGPSNIYNAGTITGFVDLTGANDGFANQSGGVFALRGTSQFGAGSDIFRNLNGGMVQAAQKGNDAEKNRFVGLERFENAGLISMVDGNANDVFRISNTPGGTNLNFIGSSNSTLAIDAFLSGPGSTADRMIVEGNVSGRTKLTVMNTNPGSATFDRTSIPVVFVDGNVNASNFFIDKPIDAGFFDYDLFFRPTGSGVFELKQHTGGGAHILPHLVTFSHDTFHNTTETWFDQSTDLRVLLARGAACGRPGHPQDAERCQQLYDFTPGVWVRGSGTWLNLQDNATTQANGRTYQHDLDRDFDVALFESGIDFGKQDLFADGDILVFGILGGGIASSLEYETLARNFTAEGGEVGAYATYLNGGLFVDTLFKALFMTVDPEAIRGFPDTLDSTTYGFRTDAGYRFGGLSYGPFIEPLATIAASWNELDDFALGGNAVDFENTENVRGRVGLRLGTSRDVWEGTTVEPFVIGSLWGTLSGDHHATLTSSGAIFEFPDEPEDVWGVVSAGVNVFNASARTAVFAKVDYTFADETSGVGVRGGMRYNW